MNFKRTIVTKTVLMVLFLSFAPYMRNKVNAEDYQEKEKMLNISATEFYLIPGIKIEADAKKMEEKKEFEMQKDTGFMQSMVFRTYIEVKYDDKIKELEEFIEENYETLKDTESAILYFKIGTLFYGRWEEYSKSNEDLKSSIKNYSKAIEKDKNDVLYFEKRALAYEDLGEIDRAIGDYTKTIELKPSFWHYLYRAGAYQKKGEIRKAKDDCERAKKIFSR